MCKVERNQLHDLDETESLRFQSVTMQFLTLNRFQLTKQMRSVDETHTRNLNLMRGPDPFVHTAMWNDYRMLSQEDFKEEKWRMCHIGVRTNAERVHLISVRAPAIAKELNTCVVRWRNPVVIGKSTYEEDFTMLGLLAKGMPAIDGLYVFRGGCMLMENVNPAKQLANGTRGTFWSIVWDRHFDLVPDATPPWRFRDEHPRPMTVDDFKHVPAGAEVWVPPPTYIVMRYGRHDTGFHEVAIPRVSVTPESGQPDPRRKLALSQIRIEPAWV